jgi:dihydroorotase
MQTGAETTYLIVGAREASGLVLMPAFVDLSAHIGDPGYLWRETLETGSLAGAAGGFGTVVAAPDTDPVIDRGPVLANQNQRARQVPGARIQFAGALTERLAGEDLSEIGCMVDAGAVALSDAGRAVADTLVLRRALEYAQPFGVPVILRPADVRLELDGVVHDGPVALRIGLRGLPSASEEIGVARAIALARLTGARVHLHGVSTARAVAQVEAAQQDGLPITCSVPARNLLLVDEDVDRTNYDTSLRLLPPVRSESDRKALVSAVRSGVAMVTAAHRPLSRVEKEHEFERSMPGAAGLETAFAATFTALDADLLATVEALCVGPAGVLGRTPGVVPGCVADLVLVDGSALEAASVPRFSKGVNEPLAGRMLQGVVKATMVAGTWVYNTLSA